LIIPRLNTTQLNMSDSTKNTALSWAVKNKNLSIIAGLLKTKDIDILSRDCFDKTPYDYAANDIIRHMLSEYQTATKGREIELKAPKSTVL
jgi:hypothetical protein